MLRLEEHADGNFVSLFERRAGFANLLSEISTARDGLKAEMADATLKQERKSRKALANLAVIDFLPARPGNTPMKPCASLNSGPLGTCRPMSRIRSMTPLLTGISGIARESAGRRDGARGRRNRKRAGLRDTILDNDRPPTLGSNILDGLSVFFEKIPKS